MRLYPLAAAALVGSVSLAGCTGTRGPTPDVALKDDFFEPDELSATTGKNFTFKNVGKNTHTVTVQKPGGGKGEYLFNRELIKPGELVQYTFPSPASYEVFCIYHSQGANGDFSGGMVMKVVAT